MWHSSGFLRKITPIEDVPSILNHHNIESELMRRRSAIETKPAKKYYFRVEARKLLSYENAKCPRFNVNFAVSPEDRDLLHKYENLYENMALS